jgi:hypothetical protein
MGEPSLLVNQAPVLSAVVTMKCPTIPLSYPKYAVRIQVPRGSMPSSPLLTITFESAVEGQGPFQEHDGENYPRVRGPGPFVGRDHPAGVIDVHRDDDGFQALQHVQVRPAAHVPQADQPDSGLSIRS